MIGTCEICNKEGPIEKHHLNYKINMTIKICKPCHRNIHNSIGIWGRLKPIDKGPQRKNILQIYVHQDLVEPFEACLKKKKMKPNAVVNQFIREKLSEEGFL